MAAEICLSQLPTLLEDPNTEFQVSVIICFDIFISQPIVYVGWILQNQYKSTSDYFM